MLSSQRESFPSTVDCDAKASREPTHFGHGVSRPDEAIMYEAIISRFCEGQVFLGPTDTRDEAARLARAWIEAHPRRGTTNAGEVVSVNIRRAENDDE